MSQPRQLFLLQQIDTEIDDCHKRLSEIEIALDDNSIFQKAKNQAQQADKRYQQTQIALKRAEQNVDAQQTKIANNERALYGGKISNPKELEDLQMESGALKRHLSTLEDKLLEAMVAFEEAENQYQSAQEHLEKTRNQIAEENVELTEEQARLQTSVLQLEKEKAQKAASITPEVMETYLELRQAKDGIAVTEVYENSCSACGANLRAAQAQAARSPSKITTCETCRRILYSK